MHYALESTSLNRFRQECNTTLDGTNESERRETIDELADLMIVVQEMGRRLADETRGNASSSVRELNELLHQSRLQLQKIRDDAIKSA